MLLGTKSTFFSSHVTYFYGQEKINILLVSLTLFLAFTKLKLKYSKFINIVASATFGVYLIHDNFLMRQYLWIDLFKNASYQDCLKLIPYSIGVVLLVYIVCTIIDLLRIYTVEKIYLKFINNNVFIQPINVLIRNVSRSIFGKD